jgi:hypothetical protein
MFLDAKWPIPKAIAAITKKTQYFSFPASFDSL